MHISNHFDKAASRRGLPDPGTTRLRCAMRARVSETRESSAPVPHFLDLTNPSSTVLSLAVGVSVCCFSRSKRLSQLLATEARGQNSFLSACTDHFGRTAFPFLPDPDHGPSTHRKKWVAGGSGRVRWGKPPTAASTDLAFTNRLGKKVVVASSSNVTP